MQRIPEIVGDQRAAHRVLVGENGEMEGASNMCNELSLWRQQSMQTPPTKFLLSKEILPLPDLYKEAHIGTISPLKMYLDSC